MEVSGGLPWALLGAALAAALAGTGSAMGITYAARAASGVLSEEPEKFGQLLVLIVLPGTQGVYGLITGFLVMIFFNLLGGGGGDISTAQGLAIFYACLPVAIAGFGSAIYQGLTSAGAVEIVTKKPEAMGRAIVLPALVETYALFAFVLSLLLLTVLR
jgi:V/A-type H+-transporting ATPase subunit K